MAGLDRVVSGATPALARQLNLRRVLGLLRHGPRLSRAELTRLSGTSAPTMSKLLESLKAAGLVMELESPAGGRGRPSKSYALSGRGVQVFGAVVGVRECRIFSAPLAWDAPKSVELTFPTPGGYAELLGRFRGFVEARLGEGGERPALALTAPGLVDTTAQRVVVCPNLRWLSGRSLASDVARGFALETVTLQEEHALCLAEQALGNVGDARDFVVLDVSEGMGMGMVSGGVYVSGAQGFSGEIGHIPMVDGGELCGCGRRGCLETVATDTALLRLASRTQGRPLDMEALRLELRRGAPGLDAALVQVLDYLAKAVAMVVNIFNPELVLVNGGLLSLGQDVLGRLGAAVGNYALAPSWERCELRRATAGRDAGVLAAAAELVLMRPLG